MRDASIAPGTVQAAPPYSEQAAAILRDAILNGRYDPGQRLNEVELSTALQISRSPIREALRKLVDEGLVVLRPGRGAFVAGFDEHEIRDLMELRVALDVLGARLAAERATDEAIERIKKSIESTTAAHLRKASSPPWSSDVHLLILEASGNRKLRERGAVLHAQLHLARFRSGASTPDRATEAHDEHVAVVEAIRRRDADAAERAMREHLSHALDHIIELVRGGERSAPAGRAPRR